MTKDTLLVFSPKIARDLLKKGFRVIDIKPHREDYCRSVFVFSNESGLEAELAKHSRV